SRGVVTVLGVWGGEELDNFREVVYPFTEKTGIGMAFEGTRDLAAVLTTRVQAGNPPDLAILPNPGQMVELAKQGKLVDISTFMDMDTLKQDYAQSWLDLASYEGKLYGIFYKAADKSLVWYNPKAFAAKGYEVPTTWDEMIALSDQIVADGGVPWCLGIESGAASGWPATDWIEDIMLRTAGPEVYDKWVAHEIPWTDPAVKTAWEYFGQIARNEQYVYGGTTGVLTINFGDSPAPLFDDPPGCYMHRQASFITGFFPEGVTEEDYAFFPFPQIDPQWGTPALGGADLIVMLNDTPEARELMKYLASPEAQEIWAAKGGFLSPNKRVSLDVYPDATTKAIAEALVSAEVFRFDASDLMPAAVGAGSFWKGTLDYVAGEDLDTVLETIEATAVDAYK
ncbi:MAG: carbohydrate ABC transporter substrate-binding protein, partial [Anaerolineae bacterium]|nr:carbohydrate ABC transporter substrate-binding protein [Anaerolineae bacterium]